MTARRHRDVVTQRCDKRNNFKFEEVTRTAQRITWLGSGLGLGCFGVQVVGPNLHGEAGDHAVCAILAGARPPPRLRAAGAHRGKRPGGQSPWLGQAAPLQDVLGLHRREGPR
eukprot:scaffold33950_cov78-Phaeocystis_antarctica.AAC.5